MTYLPAHSEAANDAALRGAPLVLYDWLIYQLEPHGFRPVKVSGVALALRWKRHKVIGALRLLCARGYLESRPLAGRSRAYRLCLTRDRAKVPVSGHSPPLA